MNAIESYFKLQLIGQIVGIVIAVIAFLVVLVWTIVGLVQEYKFRRKIKKEEQKRHERGY